MIEMARPLALITGGTSGIGLGIAKNLLRTHDLALAYAQNEVRAHDSLRALQALSHECRSEGRIEIFRKPLTEPKDAVGLYRQVCDRFEHAPNVLVNCAGRLHDGLALQSEFDEYIRVVNEHLIVTMALTQLALKPMYKEKFGRIINMSSISAVYAKRGQTNYAAAKAGIEGYTRTLALEVAHRGVTVNAVAPGLIETPMTQELVEKIEQRGGGIKQRVPAGRMGTPEEVGELVGFLCSQSASYITGTVITIDGGRSLGDPQS